MITASIILVGVSIIVSIANVVMLRRWARERRLLRAAAEQRRLQQSFADAAKSGKWAMRTTPVAKRPKPPSVG